MSASTLVVIVVVLALALLMIWVVLALAFVMICVVLALPLFTTVVVPAPMFEMIESLLVLSFVTIAVLLVLSLVVIVVVAVVILPWRVVRSLLRSVWIWSRRLELPAIIIAGGAGFRVGHAMLFPGGYRWKESVAKGGIEATQLVAGVIPMLVVAGCLEGFFSPSHAPVWLKFTVGALLFSLLMTWLFRPVKQTVTEGTRELVN